MTESLTALVQQVADRIPESAATGRRTVVAIAGPPAAGKTTLASALVEALAPRAAVLGLDAFHFDDAVLEARGERARKGAPHTFDVVSYRNTLSLVRESHGDEVAVPVFDRELELSRNCASIVSPHHDLVITEGNYLLADAPPWRDLRGLFDLTVALSISEALVEQRILDRWRSFGFSQDEAKAKAETNDLINARWIVEHSGVADVVLEST